MTNATIILKMSQSVYDKVVALMETHKEQLGLSQEIKLEHNTQYHADNENADVLARQVLSMIKGIDSFIHSNADAAPNSQIGGFVIRDRLGIRETDPNSGRHIFQLFAMPLEATPPSQAINVIQQVHISGVHRAVRHVRDEDFIGTEAVSFTAKGQYEDYAAKFFDPDPFEIK